MPVLLAIIVLVCVLQGFLAPSAGPTNPLGYARYRWANFGKFALGLVLICGLVTIFARFQLEAFVPLWVAITVYDYSIFAAGMCGLASLVCFLASAVNAVLLLFNPPKIEDDSNYF